MITALVHAAFAATLAAAAAAAAAPAAATPPAPGDHAHAHGGGDHGHGGVHGNPADIPGYIAHLEDPARDAWQKPDEVVKALGLKPGQTACDVGAGPGYFSLRLAKAVGPTGRVWAVDVEPRILEALRDRLGSAGVHNVSPILALPDDPLLPPAACDVILIVDTYHHFPDGRAYLARLARALAKGGRIANVDYDKKETPIGPPLAHRIARETFLADARAAGFTVAAEPTILPYQYFLLLTPR